MTGKKLPLEKILVVTPTEYCASVQKGLGQYELQGIICEGINQVYDSDKDYSKKFSSMPKFLSQIPENTEVVVNFAEKYERIGRDEVACGFGSQWMYTIRFCLRGTALIPRREK